jgi:Tol biopolymer transport system component
MRRRVMRGARQRAQARRLVVATAALLIWADISAARCAIAGNCAVETELISTATDGGAGNAWSEVPASDADGCVIAFKSVASNLDSSDPNGFINVFVRDRRGGTTTRVPVRVFTGSPPNQNSFPPVLDAAGQLVAFGSDATNLIRNDLNGSADVFVYALSQLADPPNILTLVLDPNDFGRGGGRVPDLPPSMTADGSVVAFTSSATDLVPSATNDPISNVFVRDVNAPTGVFELISVTTIGNPNEHAGNAPSYSPAISPDGQYVAFCSEASDLVTGNPPGVAGIFLRDRFAHSTQRLASLSRGLCGQPEVGPAIRDHGESVAFVSDLPLDGDDNGVEDVFVWNAGAITRVSRSSAGGTATGPSLFASLSADGRFVAFQSSAPNLIDPPTSGRSDVFVADITDGRIERVSISSTGAPADGDSSAPRISADGTTVVFQSSAALVPEDANADEDIYTHGNELSFTPTATWTETPTFTPSPSGTPDPTPTPTVTATAVNTATLTRTPLSTATVTPLPTHTAPPSGTPTSTATRNMPTAVIDPTPTSAPNATATQTSTVPPSATATPTPARPTPPPATAVSSASPTDTPLATATPSALPNATATATIRIDSGGGGGCSCRIGPNADAAPRALSVFAIAAPALLAASARRNRRRRVDRA